MTKESPLDIILIVELFSFVSKNNTVSIAVINMCNGNSFFIVFLFTVRFLIITATPKIRRLFVMLLPTTFPNTISELPSDKAFREIANSGALVPKATIVSPIKTFDTLKLVAVDEEPSIKISAPLIKRIKPIINSNIDNIICHLLLIILT